MNGREPEAVRLSIVPEGKTVKVRELLTTGSMRRRLLDMGLIEGTRVSCLQKSPGRGPGRLSHPGGRCRAAQRGFLPDPGGWASELNPSPFTSGSPRASPIELRTGEDKHGFNRQVDGKKRSGRGPCDSQGPPAAG